MIISKIYRETDTHIYFWGSYLSNFHWNPICSTTFDVIIPTSEHLYMLYKAAHFGDSKIFDLIVESADAKTAKQFGRQVIGFDEKIWNGVAYGYMHSALTDKFSQHKELWKLLVDTGDKVLVEASPIDKIWGVGIGQYDDRILDDKNWKGENRLGKVLMQVRSEVKNYRW